MKGLKIVILFLLIQMPSSTVFSQITGIDREQKIEIVSTLRDYPLVVKELDATRELLSTANDINQKLVSINTTLLEKSQKLERKNKISEEQLEIYKDREEIGETTVWDKLKYFGSGVGVGTILVFILKLI